MLKKVFLAVILVIITGLVVTWFTGNQPRTIKVEDLPWQIEIQSDGATRVFGATLGETSLDALSRHLQQIPEIAVFSTNEGPQVLEAFFGKTRIGVFDARFVVMLDAGPELLQQLAHDAGEPEPMPSGSWKQVVGEKDIPKVISLPVREMTYVPSVAYEPELVRQRFGEPAEILQLDESSAYWTYPDRGLAILMSEESREILQYVHPTAFPDLKQRIEQEIAARAVTDAE